MMSSPRYRVNTPNVTHETFDDEVVIINFDTGSYYSLDKVGADLWECIKNGATTDEAVEWLAQRYEGERSTIARATDHLLAELQQQLLIVADAEQKSAGNVALNSSAPSGEKPVFEAPVLQKYTDMEQLLLLDPIHEVDETGWPKAKQDT
jgi:hypothetical protein